MFFFVAMFAALFALLCFPVASALFFLCILWFVFMIERFQFDLKKKKGKKGRVLKEKKIKK